MDKPIDRHEMDTALIDAVRRGRRRKKSHVVSHKPPKRENAKVDTLSTKKLA
jgi:hypothetical protein